MEEDDSACRAEIPPMLSQEERDALAYTPRCQQRWGERPDEGAAPPPKAEDIEEFLKEFAWLKETELALQCLFEGEFDVPKAVGLLRAARRQRYKARRDRDERLPSEEFKDAVAAHGKKFHLVKKALGGKVITREVVSKYYLWKRTPEFREWRLRQTVKKTKKKKKEAELLRQWGDDSDEDSETKAFLGYHHERCELCATGGKLLCCDGCARAYHFSCVQPPITKIPRQDEDWFCAHCQKAFGGPKPKLVPNEYGYGTAPFPGVARSLSEAITDASSYEDEDDEDDNSDDEGDDDEGGAGSESNDELASEHSSNTSDRPSTEELSSNAGNPGNHTDNESDSTGIKAPSSSPRARSSGLAKQSSYAEGGSPAQQQQQVREEIKSTGPPSDSPHAHAATSRSVEHPVKSSPAGVRTLPPVQLERPGSGRKRQRKMQAPRRIPPSRFDS